ncbi:MAG: hypothetical protein K0R29_2803, partial [Pseudobdellovibrio sp.]|nr:hypothetical protein [Pseudobdellovibrio sp.]
MKISLFFAAFFVCTTNAFATKARIIALGNSFHLVDEQYAYTNPMNLQFMGNLVALETGLTTPTNTRNNAEGIISYAVTDHSRLAVLLGKIDDSMSNQRLLINSRVGAGTYILPQNPLHLMYGSVIGDYILYTGITYSSKNDKVNDLTEGTSGLILSVKTGPTILFLNYSLTNKVEAAGGLEFKGDGNLKLALRHKPANIMYGADFISWKAQSSTNGAVTEDFSLQTAIVRGAYIEKAEGSEVFYGAQLNATRVHCNKTISVDCSSDFARLSMPLYAGMEILAQDWLVVRGSISQSVIIDRLQDEIGLAASSG